MAKRMFGRSAECREQANRKINCDKNLMSGRHSPRSPFAKPAQTLDSAKNRYFGETSFTQELCRVLRRCTISGLALA